MPSATAIRIVNATSVVKVSQAFFKFFWPSRMEISALPPVPTISPRAPTTIIAGQAMLSPANGVSPT